MSENHRLETFNKWEGQLLIPKWIKSFRNNFISTITCRSSNTYNQSSIMQLLVGFHSRYPRKLPRLDKSIFASLPILPLAVTAWTGGSIVERIIIYCCFPVVAISSMWYWCFQLMPNFMSQNGREDHGVKSGFLKADFDHMELWRMTMLRSGSLALIPEAPCIDDQYKIASVESCH